MQAFTEVEGWRGFGLEVGALGTARFSFMARWGPLGVPVGGICPKLRPLNFGGSVIIIPPPWVGA